MSPSHICLTQHCEAGCMCMVCCLPTCCEYECLKAHKAMPILVTLPKPRSRLYDNVTLLYIYNIASAIGLEGKKQDIKESYNKMGISLLLTYQQYKGFSSWPSMFPTIFSFGQGLVSFEAPSFGLSNVWILCLDSMRRYQKQGTVLTPLEIKRAMIYTLRSKSCG